MLLGGTLQNNVHAKDKHPLRHSESPLVDLKPPSHLLIPSPKGFKSRLEPRFVHGYCLRGLVIPRNEESLLWALDSEFLGMTNQASGRNDEQRPLAH